MAVFGIRICDIDAFGKIYQEVQSLNHYSGASYYYLLNFIHFVSQYLLKFQFFNFLAGDFWVNVSLSAHLVNLALFLNPNQLFWNDRVVF